MVKLSTAGGIAGMWFIAWQLWVQRRARLSKESYEFAQTGHRLGNVAHPLEVARASAEARGTPARFLTVSNFNANHLDVRTSSGRGAGRQGQPRGRARRTRTPACRRREPPRAAAARVPSTTAHGGGQLTLTARTDASHAILACAPLPPSLPPTQAGVSPKNF